MEGHAFELGDLAADVGDDGVGDAEAGGFAEAGFELWNGADFAAEAEFADGEGADGERAIHVGRRDGEGDGEIDGGFGGFDAAGDVDEDIIGGEAEFGAFFQYGDDHGEAVGGDAAGFSLGGADDAGSGECLDFNEQDAGALHRGRDDGAAGLTAGAVLLDEEFAGVGDFFESLSGHFKEAHFVGAAETVFDAADDAVGMESVSFEIGDGVDDVLD